jgi:hypothetical protein
VLVQHLPGQEVHPGEVMAGPPVVGRNQKAGIRLFLAPQESTSQKYGPVPSHRSGHEL